MLELQLCPPFFDLLPAIQMCSCMQEAMPFGNVWCAAWYDESLSLSVKFPPLHQSCMFYSFAVVQSLVREASVLSSDQPTQFSSPPPTKVKFSFIIINLTGVVVVIIILGILLSSSPLAKLPNNRAFFLKTLPVPKLNIVLHTFPQIFGIVFFPLSSWFSENVQIATFWLFSWRENYTI